MKTNTSGERTDEKGGQTSGRRVLNSWKEIAGYLGRGIRTAQRYEQDASLPVHRISESEGASVLAFSDELDEWLNRRYIRERRYVRPTLIVVDRPVPGTLSDRKLVLETAYFNILTAYSAEEAYSTAERYDVDAFVVGIEAGTQAASEICESLKEQFPRKPVFAVMQGEIVDPPNGADYAIPSMAPHRLLEKVLDVLGQPRLV